MLQATSNITDKLKTILFYLTVAALFTPFLINIHTYFPFIVTKATVFRLLVEAMLIVWVLWLIRNRTFRENSTSLFSLTPLAKAVLIFGIVIFISALLGVDFHYSFFSGNERMGGVFGLWHFMLFFLIISTTFNWKEIEKILQIQVGIGLLYSFLALLAYKGVGAVTAKFTSNRLAGYTGNPSYFAAYLIFNAFLALYFYFRQFTKDKKIGNWWLLIFAFQSILIFVTGCRGAMIGYSLALLLIIGGVVFWLREKEYQSLRRLAVIILLGGIIFTGAVYYLRDTSFVQHNIALERLTSISLKAPTAVSRIMSAGSAWRAFLEKPFFGWGPENYEEAYITHFNPEVLKYLPGDFYFDRAHNKPMQVLANTGIFGFLSYLSIFVIALWQLNKLKKKKEWLLPALALEGLIIAYFVQNIFLFDFHESYLMFYLSLAFIAALGKFDVRSSTKNGEMPSTNSEKDYSSELGKYFLVIGTICLVTFTSTQWVVQPYQVSRNIFAITRQLGTGQGEKAYEILKKTINNPACWEEDVIIGTKKALVAYPSKIDSSSKKKIVDLLLEKSTSLLKKEPLRYRLISARGELETLSTSWNKDGLQEAKKISQQLLSFAPYFPNSHLFAAKVLLMDKKPKEAIKEAKKVVAMVPKDGTAYYVLAVAYSELNDTTSTKENLIKAAQHNFPLPSKKMIIKVVDWLAEMKDYKTITNLYRRAIQLDPQDVSLYAHLAATYGKLHNTKMAIKYAQKVIEMTPTASHKSAEEFIQRMEKGEWDKIGD